MYLNVMAILLPNFNNLEKQPVRYMQKQRHNKW